MNKVHGMGGVWSHADAGTFPNVLGRISVQVSQLDKHIEFIDITVLALAKNVFKNLSNVMTRARSGSGLYIQTYITTLAALHIRQVVTGS